MGVLLQTRDERLQERQGCRLGSERCGHDFLLSGSGRTIAVMAIRVRVSGPEAGCLRGKPPSSALVSPARLPIRRPGERNRHERAQVRETAGDLFSPLLGFLSDGSPRVSGQRPLTGDTGPWMASRAPSIADGSPRVSHERPPIADAKPSIDSRGPLIADQSPGVSHERPLIADTRLLIASQAPSIVDQSPGVSDQGPLIADTWPLIASQAPSIADQSPGVSDQGASDRGHEALDRLSSALDGGSIALGLGSNAFDRRQD